MNIEQVTKVREQIARLEIELSPVSKSREVAVVATSLQNARLFAGKCLGELGKESPYKNDGNRKTVEDIEKPAIDWDKFPFPYYTTDTHIEYVDTLRQSIQKVIDMVREWTPVGPIRVVLFGKVLTELMQARMYLGEEFNRIYQKNK